MIAISTPKGRGWFFEFYQRGRSEDWPEYQSFQGPTSENPFINQADVATAERELPERVFRQEYLAEFVDETGGVFEGLDETLFTADYDLPLEPAERGDTETLAAEPPFATGVDFARHQDYRVAITVDAAGRIVNFERDQHETWPQIHRAVINIAEEYPGVVAVDASRDNKIVADLEADGVPVEPVRFTAQRKRELIENLIAAIEASELTSPEIPSLRSELEVFEVDVTRGGNVRYDAPQGFHDDTVDALALAVDARTQANRQGVATTARVGGEEEYGDSDGDALAEAVSEYQNQYRRATKKWK